MKGRFSTITSKNNLSLPLVKNIIVTVEFYYIMYNNRHDHKP